MRALHGNERRKKRQQYDQTNRTHRVQQASNEEKKTARIIIIFEKKSYKWANFCRLAKCSPNEIQGVISAQEKNAYWSY